MTAQASRQRLQDLTAEQLQRKQMQDTLVLETELKNSKKNIEKLTAQQQK